MLTLRHHLFIGDVKRIRISQVSILFKICHPVTQKWGATTSCQLRTLKCQPLFNAHREIVSESPMIVKCRLARVIATFKRRFSLRNPTSCSGLLRTRLTMTASCGTHVVSGILMHAAASMIDLFTALETVYAACT